MPVNFYERRLLNEPDINKQLANIYYGIDDPHDITLEFSNADGYFTNLLASEEFRGKGVKLRRYEPLEDTPLSFELYGVITEFDITDTAKFTLSVQDPDPMQTLVPKKLYETGDWSETPPNVINPAHDLGKPYSLCFGYCKKVPLRYIHADFPNDYYDYIIGPCTIESNNSNKATTVVVYRNKVLVGNAEYYVHGGETTIQYTDASFGMTAGNATPYIKDGVSYAFIRLKKEQRDFSGNLYELHADIRGMKLGGDTSATRNFVRVIQYLMSNSLWGLGLTVDSASFDTAAGQISELLCDYSIPDQQKAQDIINELLYACRGKHEKGSNGSWIISIDVYQPTVAATFGSGDGVYENIIEIGSYKKTATREAIKNFILNYRYNEWGNNFTHNNKRNIFSFGEDQSIDMKCVRDHTTSDRITCHIQKLMQVGDIKLGIRVGMEGRNLKIRDIVAISIPRLNIDGNFQIRAIKRKLNEFDLDIIAYDSSIYIYTAGTIPGDGNSDDETDLSNTPPAAPTSFQKDAQGTYQGNDGTTFTFFKISAIAPYENCVKVIFGYKKTGEASYTFVEGDGNIQISTTFEGRIDGLVPGISYDLIAIAENTFGLKSSSNPTLTAQVAPGDTTVPAQVSGVTGSGKYKTWQFVWTKNSEPDVRSYHIQIATDSGFTGIVLDKYIEGTSTSYTNDTTSYGTLFCRAKAVDFTGNESSSWSSTASATTTQAQAGDVGDGQVTTPKIPDNSVTTPKRQFVEEQSHYFSIPPSSSNVYTFTHSLGRKVLVTYVMNSVTTYPAAVMIVNDSSTGFSIYIYNAGVATYEGTLYVRYW